MKAALLRADAWLQRLDTAMLAVSSVAVVAMMVITFIDVFMRYVVNAPMKWANEVVLQYLLIGSFYFAFSYTLRVNENVGVDFFSRGFSREMHCRLMALGHGAVTPIVVAITWLSAHDTWTAWVNDEAILGSMVWPAWSSKAIIPLGALALALRLAHRSLAYAASVHDPDFQQACGLENNRSMDLKEHG